MTDAELLEWATAEDYTVLTENVRDFRPLVTAKLAANAPSAPMLFTSSRGFPRSRQHLGALITGARGVAWMLGGVRRRLTPPV